MKKFTLLPALAVGILFVCLLAEVRAQYGSLLLTEVQTLTFFKDRNTNARRSAPIPQLKCIGDSSICNSRYFPSAVQCYNMGLDGIDVQWRCEAELDADVAFDAVHVSCEGFRDPDDAFVLEGSCGLEYKLKWTNAYHDKVRETRQKQREEKQSYVRSTPTSYSNNDNSDDLSSWTPFFTLCAIALFITWCMRRGNRAATNPAPSAPPAVDPVYTAPPQPSGPTFGEGVALGALGGATAAHIIHSQRTTTETTYHDSPTSSSHSATRRNTSPSPEPDNTHKSTGFGTTSRR